MDLEVIESVVLLRWAAVLVEYGNVVEAAPERVGLIVLRVVVLVRVVVVVRVLLVVRAALVARVVVVVRVVIFARLVVVRVAVVVRVVCVVRVVLARVAVGRIDVVVEGEVDV